jgi:hypothetical protein
MNKIYQAHMHAHAHAHRLFFKTFTISIEATVPPGNYCIEVPCEEIQINCTDSILSPCSTIIITVELLSSKDTLRPKKMAIQKRWITIVVDRNPKVLGHECGGCCNTSFILAWSFRPCGMLHGHEG